MNFQNHVHFTTQRTAGLRVKQQLRHRRVTDFPGGKVLWIAAAKASCITLVVVCASVLWMQSLNSQMEVSIQAVEANLHTLRNDQITLLAERARLMSAKNIHSQAQRALALYVPEKGQVYKIR